MQKVVQMDTRYHTTKGGWQYPQVQQFNQRVMSVSVCMSLKCVCVYIYIHTYDMCVFLLKQPSYP